MPTKVAKNRAASLAKVDRAKRYTVPEAVAAGRLATEKIDLLSMPAPLAGRRFDLVFSFGVLHHTGDTRRALGNVAGLTRHDGVLFAYLYGARSLIPGKVARSVFVIDAKGIIRYRDVRPLGLFRPKDDEVIAAIGAAGKQ